VSCPGGLNVALYPAADGKVLAVASIDQNLQRSSFSNSNSYVSIAAPGGRIISACPASLPASNCPPSNFPGYSYKSGTSMATPFVSAAAALLTAACPNSPRDQTWVNFVQHRLESTAQAVGGETLPDADYGAGILDAGSALTNLTCP
jgi:subtilisin family serine protease